MRMNLSSYPTPPKTYVVDFPKLTGGLNLWELDYRMSADQSPHMKNLWWQDGVLQCRDGQVWLSEDTSLGVGYTCYDTLFWGCAFFHIGAGIYYADMSAETFELKELVSDVPGNRGTFFRYLDWLFYKNKGGFYRITYNPGSAAPFTAAGMEMLAYTPVISINTDPASGAGDTYQPENRLSPLKTVRYNAKADVKEYVLPIIAIDSVTKVVVDGETLTAGTDYTVNADGGIVTFTTAPPVTNPPTNNTVEITFSKANTDAYNSVMDCEYAMVSGGDTNLCVLLAGCDAQPNAVFWNSNDNLSMNPGYWPISYYNLVGDTEDPVTGFGRQYSDTIVLKEHSVGKLDFGVESVDERNSISFTYTNINSKVGCDLPWSIQLIENNLVFCNTYQGVHVIRSSSAAYENNVECISRNIHGHAKSQRTMYRDDGETILGLLHDVRQGGAVTSFDDDDRYWLCANGNVYVWDYVVSTYSKPSWFYFTGIRAVSFFKDEEHGLYHLDGLGRLTEFTRCFADYGEAIEKRYQFPTQYFGSYDRLKDVTSVLIALRSDTDTQVDIEYSTDYETRIDLTPIRSYSWRLSPRNLAQRCLTVPRFAHTARRRPGCRHVHHFSMALFNNTIGADLAIVSAQIFYKYQGKER